MLIRDKFLRDIRVLLQIAGIFLAVLMLPVITYCQEPRDVDSLNIYPPGYNTLQTSKEKMLLLEKAINDSLDEDQLTHVYQWARTGLH